jgi:hypothetical protein
MHVHKRCTWLLILQYWWTSFQHFKVPEFRKILPPSEQNRIIKSPSPHTKFWMNISRDLIQFLDLFWISSLLNDIKYQLCYLKWCLCTQKFYLFIVTSIFLIIISCSFSVFFENCILLPKCINEFVVFLCIVHLWFWFFSPFTHIFIIGHKGTIFSKNNNSVSECIFFIYKNVASKPLYKSKIHPFPLMIMQRMKCDTRIHR